MCLGNLGYYNLENTRVITPGPCYMPSRNCTYSFEKSYLEMDSFITRHFAKLYFLSSILYYFDRTFVLYLSIHEDFVYSFKTFWCIFYARESSIRKGLIFEIFPPIEYKTGKIYETKNKNPCLFQKK